MAEFRPTLTIGIVALFFALSPARGDQDLGAATPLDGRQDMTAATDSLHPEAAAIVVRADLDAILNAAWDFPSDAAARIINFLTFGSELHPDAEIYDIEIADRDTESAVVTGARQGKARIGTIGDLLVPASMLLVGTALASFAFMARRRRHPSRRLYYSSYSVAVFPQSRIAPLQTSPSVGSCEPNPRENSAHSSPRKRLA